jgi:integrase
VTGQDSGRRSAQGHARPDSARATVILTTTNNTAWTEDGFRASWGKACTKADIPDDLTFHDIRGSAITRLAEAGCEVPEIATITGHSLADLEAILDAHYLGRDNQTRDVRSPSWSVPRQ